MLKLYFGNIKGAILSGDDYFDNMTPTEILETNLGSKIVENIEKGRVVSRNNIIIPVIGSISPESLSGGSKSLLSLLYDPSILLDMACIGDNCFSSLSLVVKNAENRGVDVNMCSDTFRYMYENGFNDRIFVINSKKFVTSSNELRKEWVSLL